MREVRSWILVNDEVVIVIPLPSLHKCTAGKGTVQRTDFSKKQGAGRYVLPLDPNPFLVAFSGGLRSEG